MSPLLGARASALAATWPAAPLDPGRDQARDWARRELADPVYAQARPGWVERLVAWALARLDALQLPGGLAPGRALGLALLVGLLALLVVLVLRRTGFVRRGARAGSAAGAVLDDVRRTAAEHRRLADEAAAVGRYDVAVRERFRAVVRSLEERTLLEERAGRTATEVAVDAARVLPGHAVELAAAARVFDDVRYGGHPAGAGHDTRLRRLDEAVAAARPALAHTGTDPAPAPGSPR